jgi:drug/metabolite transporter (DMT)-like permease
MNDSIFDLMRKGTVKQAVVPPKQYKLSYLYGFLSALLFAVANVLNAEVSKLGMNSIWTVWLGMILVYLMYHTYHFTSY